MLEVEVGCRWKWRLSSELLCRSQARSNEPAKCAGRAHLATRGRDVDWKVKKSFEPMVKICTILRRMWAYLMAVVETLHETF